MSEETTGSGKSLSAPAPTAPIADKAIDDAGAITFRWDEVDGAAAYQLQIAEDPAFSELVLNVEVGDATSRTVKGIFQEYGREYFWRVRAGDEAGNWGPFSESLRFLVPTEEELEQRAAEAERPEEVEESGPAAELFKAAGMEVAAEVTGEEEYERAAHEMGVEEEGIPAKQIVMLTAVTLIIIAGLVIAVFVMVNISTDEVSGRYTSGVEYPELRENRSESARQLTQYDIVDQDEEVYRIPIERAIDLVLSEYDAPEDQPAGSDGEEE